MWDFFNAIFASYNGTGYQLSEFVKAFSQVIRTII